MEQNARVVLWGDRQASLYVEEFRARLCEKYADKNPSVVIWGDTVQTTEEALKSIDEVMASRPDVVVLGFGSEDAERGISLKAFEKNLLTMCSCLAAHGARVVLMNQHPILAREGVSPEAVADGNKRIEAVALAEKVKLADVNSLWNAEVKPSATGLNPDNLPNARGCRAIATSLMRIVPYHFTTVLWQYNGREAKCNYSCPYCYYSWAPKQTDYFFGTVDQWQFAFKRAFGNQNLVFYLAFGEPMYGAAFYDVVRMIEAEPRWSLRITSNVSQPLERLLSTKLVEEGRLNINASFHPYATAIEPFLAQILSLREHGIEVPVVYVLYPGLLKRFESHFEVLNKHGFLIHIRRFIGKYKGKVYPMAYTDEERRFVARYCDDATIRYMLNERNVQGQLSNSGLHFFAVDSVGNVGLDADCFAAGTMYRSLLGNILQDSFRPLVNPSVYPGRIEGTVDGIANLLDLGYRELENNNVLAFSRQGGAYHTPEGVHYKHLHTDFLDPDVRAEYGFPLRNFKDRLSVAKRSGYGKYFLSVTKSRGRSMRRSLKRRILRTFGR